MKANSMCFLQLYLANQEQFLERQMNISGGCVLSDDDSTGGHGGRSGDGGDSGIQLVAVVYICVHLTTGFYAPRLLITRIF
ncbi:hypothetical protein NC652_031785 [Populus alba x Populus x berolinensis]|nr:hypothetical protein NC652_031785 [Populus alba x Populus x berolinensis]